MRRREFFKLVGGVAAGWPLDAFAQQQAGKQPRIGIISVEPGELTESFSQGLREAGYVDGQNIILDTRYYHDSLERIDEFARELVALKSSTIVAGSPYAIGPY
jgi:putative ABC transport system substrate-binding protein